MNDSLAMSIFAWLGEHPILAGFFIFFVALVESLAVVGIFVPGIALMLVIGAYLATGQFSFFTAVLLTFLGAVVGDSISFYIGGRFKDKLSSIWPISHYPETFQKGIVFFKRHGSKSIVLGRFIGPLRALIPAIAGMFQMPQKQFFFSNILSALIWAPAVLLPGYAIGLSLEFAGDIAGRLILLILFISIVLWVIFIFLRFIYLYLLPRFDDGVVYLLKWSLKHPLPGKASNILLDKKYSDKKVFGVLLFLSVLLSSLFFVTPELFYTIENKSNVDILLRNLFSTLNSPASNQFMATILNFTELKWLLFLSFFTLVVIVWKKQITLLRYFLFTAAIILLLQLILYSFGIDSNNNLSKTSLYLFLTFLLTSNSSPKRKLLIYSFCYTLLMATIIAHLYNNNTSLFSLALTSSFSFIWIIIIASTYHLHVNGGLLTVQFQNKMGIMLLLFMIINIIVTPSSAPVPIKQNNNLTVEYFTWEKHLWKNLPDHRLGFINKTKHPFNIQWIGSKHDIISTMDTISSSEYPKWIISSPPKFSNILQILNPQANISSLAIYPHLHNGVYEQLRFIRYNNTENLSNEIIVLRLWQTRFNIKQFDPEKIEKKLWQGTITKLIIENRAGVKVLRTRLLNKVEFMKEVVFLKSFIIETRLKYNKKENIQVLLLSH